MREDRQRLDKWLWFARFAKTRTLAAKMVTSGYVRLNGQRTDNAAKAVAVGDVVPQRKECRLDVDARC